MKVASIGAAISAGTASSPFAGQAGQVPIEADSDPSPAGDSTRPALGNRPSRVRSVLLDVCVVAALAGFAWWALGFLVRNDLYIFADNPGTYFRLWWLLDSSPNQWLDLLGWNPYWWAGWPEWQFYPPSYGLAGLGLKLLALGKLSSVQIYELMLFGSYLLPALVAYMCLTSFGLGRWVGFVAGYFMLVFPDLYGGVGGVMIGMLGDRPALGLMPLAWLFGLSAVKGKRTAFAFAALGLTLGAIILLHPFRALLPCLMVVLTVALSDWRRLPRAIALLIGGTALAFLLVGFWLVPLMTQSSLQIPVLRAELDALPFWLMGGRLPFFLIFAAWGLVRATSAERLERALLLALAIAPAIMLAFMLFDWLVLVDRLHFYALDPIRFIEDVYLPVILLAAAGFVDLVRTAFQRARAIRPRVFGFGAAALASASLMFLTFQPVPRMLEGFRPREGAEPRFLSDAVRDYRLDKLWDVLRSNPDGRVLFTSSVFRLRQAGENVPSYLMALAPIFTGREIVGGTFQHWAPVSTFYWYGSKRPEVMRDRTDLKDDQTIFGLPWRQMSEPTLLDALRKLNVTDLVATDYDLWTRTYLDRSPAFKAVYNDPQYVVYRVQGYAPSLIDADPSMARVRASRQGDQLRIFVDEARSGAEALLKVTYLPRWHAETSAGPVSLAPDEIGLTRVRLAAGRGYEIVMRYESGLAERVGIAATGAGLVIVVVLLLAGFMRWRKRMAGSDRSIR